MNSLKNMEMISIQQLNGLKKNFVKNKIRVVEKKNLAHAEMNIFVGGMEV